MVAALATPTPTWYLLLAAVLFALGTVGLLIRRNPLIMASAAKAAAFAALVRVIVVGLAPYEDDWQPVIWVLAVITEIGPAGGWPG